MKNFFKKIGYSLMVLSLLFAYAATNTVSAATSDQHSCNGSTGNLYGYINTENLGPIYLSTESWNQLGAGADTSTNFSVNYDRQTGIWSGRGWAGGTNQIDATGWVDFSYDQAHNIVRFVKPGEADDAGDVDKYGNWNGQADLSGVVYSSQNGSFQGSGLDSHTDTGGVNSETEDDYIGSGEWTFENVQFQDPACPQNVNLFIEGTSRLHRSSCNINNALIQWTTENVVSDSCTATAGFWTLNTARSSQNTGTSVHANQSITKNNSPVTFKLECIGEFDGQPVEGIAVASCGDYVCEGSDCHGFENDIIKPVFIEA